MTAEHPNRPPRKGKSKPPTGRKIGEERKMIDRPEVSRALAKAIAYKQCGKDKDAEEWAIKLIRLLELSSILKAE